VKAGLAVETDAADSRQRKMKSFFNRWLLKIDIDNKKAE
jgi:hypothetical protein